MNRAEKRRQKKLAEKAARLAKPERSANVSPEQQTLTIQEAIDLAVQHQTAGRFPEAEGIYQRILQTDPNHPTALHLLGVIAHPPDTEEMFTEELHRLPVFYQYPPIEEAPLVETLPADKAGFVTFASFNNPAKINEEVIRLWAEVLKTVPGSRLLLKYKNWYEQVSLRDRMVERFAAAGIGMERVTFAASTNSFEEHLGRYDEVDIALDPFPFNGATTTFQALWMGIPVVSLAGKTFISRAAGSILHHAGLGDMVVDTPEAYVACTHDLAGDFERLKTLRATLRERIATSPFCDAPGHARSVEAAYRDMWRTRCAGPRNIR